MDEKMNFNDAQLASENMMEQLPEQEVEQEVEQEAEQADTSITEQAVNTAEVATNAVAEREAQIQQLQQALAQQNQQLQYMQQLIEQQNQVQEQAVTSEAQNPLPMLDVSALSFADENTIQQIQAEYAQQMAQYMENMLMGKLAPYIEQSERTRSEHEANNAIQALSQMPELPGIADMRPQLDHIIANNKVLQGVSNADERYLTAYLIAKGVGSLNQKPPSPPTPQELLEMYKSNPEFMDLVEQERLKKLQQVPDMPPLSASNGAFNAALYTPSKAKTLDDARELAFKL